MLQLGLGEGTGGFGAEDPPDAGRGDGDVLDLVDGGVVLLLELPEPFLDEFALSGEVEVGHDVPHDGGVGDAAEGDGVEDADVVLREELRGLNGRSGDVVGEDGDAGERAEVLLGVHGEDELVALGSALGVLEEGGVDESAVHDAHCVGQPITEPDAAPLDLVEIPALHCLTYTGWFTYHFCSVSWGNRADGSIRDRPRP